MMKRVMVTENAKGMFRRFLTGCAGLLALVTCTNFPTPLENIVAGQKFRPLAVVCTPPEAAPGDTVQVRFYYYDPPEESPALHWLVSLDYGIDQHNSVYEKQVVDLDSMMLPGGTVESFRFRVPDSVLTQSTQVSELANDRIANPLHLSVLSADSILRAAANLGSVPSQIVALADNFTGRILLRAQVRADISLDVTMPLRIRYSSKLHSPNVEVNPSIKWVGIITVHQADFNRIDSLSTAVWSMQYLLNADHPDSVKDTVRIDSGCSYLAVADTGDYENPQFKRPTYTYFSKIDNATLLDTENYRYQWFFTNIDYANGMIMDSLLMFGSGGSGSMRSLLPPVDTGMHRFQLYCTARSSRPNDAGATPGVAYVTSPGYFAYSDAYARNLVRNGTYRRNRYGF